MAPWYVVSLLNNHFSTDAIRATFYDKRSQYPTTVYVIPLLHCCYMSMVVLTIHPRISRPLDTAESIVKTLPTNYAGSLSTGQTLQVINDTFAKDVC